ncbi:DNA excision repair protein ERCC-1 [Mucor circinelloides 1006PhL]|uniref:DNA excision repair protein ERCC-1 n=1 Tax=Mucor circinelloides f. circinelloides (strain 1006PhL) TaxID=1220926 RepID=S2J7M5_MUCC1|nr:DNA excision repair protein ERCC-1 [Mucor circinelloides 1006PhL]
MSDQQDSSSSKPTWNIPTIEEIEKRKAEKSKQTISFFKSKRTIAQANAAEDTNASSTSSATTTAETSIHNNTPATAAATPLVATRTTTSSPARSNISSPFNRPSLSSTSSVRRAAGNTILVNPTQQKNPILKHVHNVPWEPSEVIKVDYVVGQTTGVIYLSLRYHRLYPTYIYDRLNSVRNLYVNRILLVYVDVDSFHDALREINRIAILSDFTLMLAWSPEEAGRYLETYKAFENKAPDMIREKVDDEYFAKMTDCLTQIRSVNKTDVLTLLSTFGSLKQVAEAKTDALAMCPGFGEQKVRRLQQTWKQPFLANKKQKKQ